MSFLKILNKIFPKKEEISKYKGDYHSDEILVANGLWSLKKASRTGNNTTTQEFNYKEGVHLIKSKENFYEDIFTGEKYESKETADRGFMVMKKIVYKENLFKLTSLISGLKSMWYTNRELLEFKSFLESHPEKFDATPPLGSEFSRLDSDIDGLN